MSPRRPHRLPPWAVAAGLAFPWSPPGQPTGWIPDDVLLLLLTIAIAVMGWRGAERLDLRGLQIGCGAGFGLSLLCKHGAPDHLLPAVAMISGALLYGVAFPWAAARLFGDDAARPPAG